MPLEKLLLRGELQIRDTKNQINTFLERPLNETWEYAFNFHLSTYRVGNLNSLTNARLNTQNYHCIITVLVKAILQDFFPNLDLPKCNRKYFKGYEQTCILFKLCIEMVENGTLCQISFFFF